LGTDLTKISLNLKNDSINPSRELWSRHNISQHIVHYQLCNYDLSPTFIHPCVILQHEIDFRAVKNCISLTGTVTKEQLAASFFSEVIDRGGGEILRKQIR
jgi:hypothetical protein